MLLNKTMPNEITQKLTEKITKRPRESLKIVPFTESRRMNRN